MKSYSWFKIFTMLFGVFYTAAFISVWSPFRYYPMLRRFYLHEQGPEAGPAILWYGWVVSAIVASALVALLVPRRFADRLWHGYTWVVPVIVLLVILYNQKHWFM